jgi:hypothetical protein
LLTNTQRINLNLVLSRREVVQPQFRQVHDDAFPGTSGSSICEGINT